MIDSPQPPAWNPTPAGPKAPVWLVVVSTIIGLQALSALSFASIAGIIGLIVTGIPGQAAGPLTAVLLCSSVAGFAVSILLISTFVGLRRRRRWAWMTAIVVQALCVGIGAFILGWILFALVAETRDAYNTQSSIPLIVQVGSFPLIGLIGLIGLLVKSTRALFAADQILANSS